MRPLLLLLLLALFAAAPAPAAAQAPVAQAPVAAQAPAAAPQQQAAYTLPPEKLHRAIVYSHERMLLSIAADLWSVGKLWLLLALGLAGGMRDIAVRLTRSRWLQCIAFLGQLLLAVALLDLPIGLIGHHLAVVYGQSVQSWMSWSWDHGKQLLVAWGGGTLAVMLLFWIIRRSPTRWWLWLWMISVPITLIGVYATPLYYDPLFHHFERLQNSDPALVARLEQVVARTGIDIPPERIFLMRASAKVTGINAYVTGLGPSKRFVMWDTALAKLTPDEVLFVFGHESGHYVLHHIAQGIVFSIALSFVGLYLGFRMLRWMLVRFGPRWGVPSQADWAALVVLVMVLNLLSVAGMPLTNAFSRHIEHQADIYGQEAIHGLVADPQATAVGAFQRLGEASLDDPKVNPVVEFWMYNHPSVGRRAAFAQGYDPWAEGKHPQYFPK